MMVRGTGKLYGGSANPGALGGVVESDDNSMQPRGPMIYRISRQLAKLSGGVDCSEWLSDFEWSCRAERVDSAEIITYNKYVL